jgi:hypothetical protein
VISQPRRQNQCRSGVSVDALINERWQAGLCPFDGECLVSDEPISVEDLRTILAAIFPELQRDRAAQELFMFDDWHQHDGYVTERRGSLDFLGGCYSKH